MKIKSATKVLSPVLVIAMLISLVAVLAPPGVARAEDPPELTLYGANPNAFGIYDRGPGATGAFTEILNLGGDAEPGGATVGPDGGLYAYDNSSDELLLVNHATGGSETYGYYPDFEDVVTGLAYNPTTGLFYGSTINQDLYSFTADSFTLIGDIFSTTLESFMNIGGLTFAGGDVLFGAGTDKTGQVYQVNIDYSSVGSANTTNELALGAAEQFGPIGACTYDPVLAVLTCSSSGGTAGDVLFDAWLLDPGYVDNIRSVDANVPTALAIMEGALPEAPVFLDDMESGTNGWTADGFWHQIAHAQTISVLNVGGATPAAGTEEDPLNDINPDLVTLPDTDAEGKAYLPEANSGITSWWYGVDASGTFIDTTFDLALQEAKGGGTSSAANSGSLTSPAFSLSGLDAAALEFWTWWEIEGVDADTYDMMYVQASSDGTNWTGLGTLNPLNDVNNESYQNYSSGGSNATPVWVHNVFDLSDYAGESSVQVRFYFDTIDDLYNGFRGWFIDDVKVTDDTLEAPVITDVQPEVVVDPSTIVTISGENFANGAAVTIGEYPVLDDVVIGSHEIHCLLDASMPEGVYDVTVTNPDGQSDSFSSLTFGGSLVMPSTVEEILYQGQSITVEKQVTVPYLPPAVDILLLEDESGSFGDDIDNLQELAPDIFDAIRAQVPDSQFGVAGFCDFPIDPWGITGDVAYRLIQDLTTDKTTFLDGVNLLTAVSGAGGDEPESQLVGLYQVATGEGLDLNGDGNYDGEGEIAPDLNPTFREDALKVVILATDASFHYPTDGTGTYAYPGPSYDDTVAALNAAGIVVIGIQSGDITQLQDIAAATGGAVQSVSTTGEEIANAIMEGLGSLVYKVEPVVNGADPLTVTFDPTVHADVPGGSVVTFQETITVPLDTTPGVYEFTVDFLANGGLIGTQTVTIEVPPLVSPPYVEAEIHQGDSLVIEKQVFVPYLPPAVDVMWLEDESGSFGDDIDNLQELAPDIFDAIRAQVPDSQFGVAGFCDFPFSPWGSTGDVAYRLIEDLTTDKATFLAGVDLLSASGGNDGPESQLVGLYQIATGEGLDANGDGDYADAGDIAPGLNPTFREDALKVVILATDAGFHYPTDGTGTYPYPGPSFEDTVAALNDAGIVVIGIQSGTITQLGDIADATGGVVQSVSTTGEDVADAIADGLGALDYTVEAKVNGADPLIVTFDPAVHEDVPGGTLVTFTETITAPADIAGVFSFTVDFLANDGLIGTQEVFIRVTGVAPGIVEKDMYQEDTLVIEKSLYLSESASYDTVTLAIIGDSPLGLVIEPPVYESVAAGSVLTFIETIHVPWCTPEGEYSRTVQFLGDGEVILAEQVINITVKPFPWAILLYLDGDNTSAAAASLVLEQLAMAPFDMVPVIVLHDGPSVGDSQIYRNYAGHTVSMMVSPTGLMPVDDEGAVIPLKDHEVNMGDPQTLENFISWARDYSHAAKHALVMWDNGAGWRTSSFLKDMNSCGDDITMRELEEALAGATDNGEDKLEVIGFDAPFMQMLEVDYQIADYGLFAVGPEGRIAHTLVAGGLPYGAILAELLTNNNPTPAEMAALFVAQYGIYAAERPAATMSAKDLSKIDDLVIATDAFAAALIDAIGTYDKEIATARSMAETFGGLEIGSIDLYHFAQLIAGALPDTALATAATAVMDAVDAAVLDGANFTNSLHPEAHGIAIYYPDINDYSGLQVMLYEPAYDVDPPFADDTLWNEYLKLAPRLVEEGILAMYVPDVLILAHVYEDPIVRLAPMGEYLVDDPEFWADFTVAKPVDIVVTPEGTIDIGIVAMLYTQADLNEADILKTQLMGISQWNGAKWALENFTMDIPTWLFDMAGGMFDMLGATMDEMMTGLTDEVSAAMDGTPEALAGILEEMSTASVPISTGCDQYMPGYIGAVVAVPWLDLGNIAPCIYDVIPTLPKVSSSEVTSLGMIATNQAEYLTPIQYPQMLVTGWNAFSLPVIPLDSDIETILSGHGGVVDGIMDSVEIVWAYDAATGEWLRYIPGAPEASDLFELKDGLAYWIEMKEGATLTVLGSNMLAGPSAPPEYELVEGWNFIGYKGILPMTPLGDSYYYEYGYEEGEEYWGYTYDGEYYYEEWYELYYYAEWEEGEVSVGGYLEEDKVTYNRLQGYNGVIGQYTPEYLYPNDGYWIYVAEAGSIPGLNDEVWVDALNYDYYPMLEATAEWLGFWMARDAELGLRMAWNAMWYAGWVVIPGSMGYSGIYY